MILMITSPTKSIRRNIIWASFLWLILSGVAHAKTYQSIPRYSRQLHTNTSKLKFGPQIGLGPFSGGIGLFADYKYAKDKSIQLSVLYFMNDYFIGSFDLPHGGSALVKARYISIPILSRSYTVSPRDKNVEVGFFWGIQLGYLVDAKFLFKDEKILNTNKFLFSLMDDFIKITPTNLQEVAEQTKIRRWQIGFVVGYDLEFKSGIMLGVTYTRDFITIIQAKQSRSNWTYQSRFGYNLAKLFV